MVSKHLKFIFGFSLISASSIVLGADFVVAEIYARHESDTTLPIIESVSIAGQKMLQHKASRKDLVRFKFGEILPKTNSYEIKVQPKGFNEISEILTPRPITAFNIKEDKISKTNGFTIT
mgnify:CR=1 FL=1